MRNSIRKDSYIVISDSIICRVDEVSGDRVEFYVVNGGWPGVYDISTHCLEVIGDPHSRFYSLSKNVKITHTYLPGESLTSYWDYVEMKSPLGRLGWRINRILNYYKFNFTSKTEQVRIKLAKMIYPSVFIREDYESQDDIPF